MNAMTENSIRSHMWDRYLPLWHGAFAFLVVLCATVASAEKPFEGAIVVWAFAGALLAWYLPGIRWKTDHWVGRYATGALYLAVGWALWLGAVSVNSVFLMLLSVLPAQVFMFMPMRWAIFGTMCMAVVVIWRIVVTSGGLIWVFGMVVTATMGILLGNFINDIVRQSRERRDLIDELQRTRAELSLAEREAGMLAERGRLAREIHDTLAQGLVGIITQLEATENITDDATRRAHIVQARTLARQSLAESRRFVQALRPSQLEGRSLAAALRDLLTTSGLEHLRADFVISGTVHPLPLERETALLRIAQEALHNVYKHAQATSVTLTLTYFDDMALLDIQDDGTGFDPEAVAGDRYGIAGMHERITLIGGTLEIESTPGEGTTVVATVPVTAKTGERVTDDNPIVDRG